jgi:hypothetical protein
MKLTLKIAQLPWDGHVLRMNSRKSEVDIARGGGKTLLRENFNLDASYVEDEREQWNVARLTAVPARREDGRGRDFVGAAAAAALSRMQSERDPRTRFESSATKIGTHTTVGHLNPLPFQKTLTISTATKCLTKVTLTFPLFSLKLL